jgi:hypothetical protein
VNVLLEGTLRVYIFRELTSIGYVKLIKKEEQKMFLDMINLPESL